MQREGVSANASSHRGAGLLTRNMYRKLSGQTTPEKDTSKDNELEEAESIVKEYGRVVAAIFKVSPTEGPARKYPVSLLPYDKHQIKTALEKVITAVEKLSFIFNKWETKDNQKQQEDLSNRRDHLKNLLLQLDNFVPDEQVRVANK